ncbi:glycosyltransferase [Methylobacterium mesophilicum]
MLGQLEVERREVNLLRAAVVRLSAEMRGVLSAATERAELTTALATARDDIHTLQASLASLASQQGQEQEAARRSEIWAWYARTLIAAAETRLRELDGRFESLRDEEAGRRWSSLAGEGVDVAFVRHLVRASGLFDPDAYLAINGDVAAAGSDPLDHYLTYGGQEGRDLGSRFDANGYLTINRDVAEAGTNPLAHFLCFGLLEGRGFECLRTETDPDAAEVVDVASLPESASAETSNTGFDDDPFPGRPKILFIGWGESSHTASWIDLLDGQPFNVRLFCLPWMQPAQDWPVRSYLTAPHLPRRDDASRRTVQPADLAVAPWNGITTVEGALAQVIRTWQPDVIHTLGFDPAAFLYHQTRAQYDLAGIGTWIAQARGGPDLVLNQYNPGKRQVIEEIMQACDHFIADNAQNYELAGRLGLDEAKASNPGLGVVSGPGGLDIDELRSRWTALPSRRERVIVWPKAYEINSAKAMPVFEAIVKYWPQLAPCRIEMLWMTQEEVQYWYERVIPDEIKAHCVRHSRLSRDETLAHIARARVLLAPSLLDGIPNTMMEAMALGAAPLVSPLDTITPVVEPEVNVLFARNLYPDEIGEQLVRLMSDDALVDRMAEANVERVRVMADRARIRPTAIAYYESVSARSRARRSAAHGG